MGRRAGSRGTSGERAIREGANEGGGVGGVGATAAGVEPAAGAVLLATSGTGASPVIDETWR